MSRLGIFLAYAPEQSLAEHGLGRLLAMLVRGLLDRGAQLTIATPHWSAGLVRDVLRDFDVNEEQVQWLVTPGDPVLLRLRRVLMGMREPGRGEFGRLTRPPWRWLKATWSAAANAISRGLTTTSPILFLLTALVLVAIPAAIVVMLVRHAPFLLAIVVVGLLAWLAWQLVPRPIASLPARAARRWLGHAWAPLRQFKRSATARRLYSVMRQQEMKRLLARINAVKDVEAWLVPTLFWPEAADIRVRKVVVVPDLVMLESPVHYAEYASIQTFEQLRATIRCADHLICYSEHVKNAHLVHRFGIDPARISVIDHAPVDLGAAFRDPLHAALPLGRAAAMTLRRYASNPGVHRKLRGVDLAQVPFVFYASQYRPHKNLLTLIRAYQRLLRRDLVNVKLVLTADLDAPAAERLRHYIWQHRLQYDVISLPRLPAPVLSALFALARLAVCPTLFEGGLPFTFSEALSVGTPVVMSRIPVVTEKIPDGSLAQAMLFDPYDEADACARTRWALDHREELLALQRPLYERLAARTWKDVAADYLAVVSPASTAEPA